MTADRWAQVTALFEKALDRPAAERAAWVQQSGADDAVRAEVLALLATYDTDPDFLEQPAVLPGPPDADADRLAGQRLGAYRLERQIGRGGMGVVYEAHRDDREFDRRTAIKILPAWSASPLIERFQFERRVLAELDHPGIARLLDAGTTADGGPYFVMEFVDGQPIDVWCRQQRLTIRQRVALIERVCDAVGYAHQHLVVHRDLKPGNILVTADGTPKLLDFGIAALLSEDGGTSAGLTRLGHQSFTPEFASPEQIRGERVATASDVYSLGVLTYALLAERLPYDVAHLAPLEVMRVVCDVDPPVMSAVGGAASQRILRGDLDTIVATALRKKAAERYRTVAEFAADLRAWREGRPVAAAPATWTYRSRRFVARHRSAVAAAAALAVAITGGAAATAWQARLARQQRDRAQNRFTQVQQFSRSLLFDVHDALRNLPGATEPRRLLLDRAVQFLDGLAADADDDALEMELAEGYRRLGHVQGSSYSQNVGDTAAAAASFEKATRLADALLARRPEAVDRLQLAILAYYDLATTRLARAEPAAAEAAEQRHLELVQDLERRHAGNAAARAAAARGYSDQGVLRATRRDLDAASGFYRRAVALYETLPSDDPARAEHLEVYAQVLKRLGAVEMVAGEFPDSERHYRTALALDEAALDRDPGNRDARYFTTFALSDLGLVVWRQGRADEATALWTRAMDIRQAALDDDPKDVRALSGVATLLSRLGAVAAGAKDYPLAARHFRDELRRREAVLAARGPTPVVRQSRALAQVNLALTLLDLAAAADAGEAARHLAEATRLARSVQPEQMPKAGDAGFDPDFTESYARLLSRLKGAPPASTPATR